MNIIKSIRTLRIVAFFLFLLPSIGLLGSVLFHNYLVTFQYDKDLIFNFKTDEPGENVSMRCTKNNDYCSTESETFQFQISKKLDDCYKNEVISFFEKENGEIIEIKDIEEIKNIDDTIFRKYVVSNKLSDRCILNSDNLVYYKLFPLFFETFHNLKTHKNTQFGTGFPVNPFLKGETSISNIVKRFPFNFFFKPILYLTVILMLFYWYYFNMIVKKLLDYNKNFYFFFFGILSAIFLLLHVFFLGWTFESEFLTKLRRTFVVFFILFEILSQAFLIKKLMTIKDKYIEYLKSFIIYFKLIFVIFICSSSFIILTILAFYNFPPKIDYILEWNYFLILLIFYFLSFLMWKKTN